MNEARPRTDLVLRMYMNAGNYDYLFDWVLSQDGAITVNLGATGMDQVKAASGTPTDNDYGRMIANKLVGVNHSHFRTDLLQHGHEIVLRGVLAVQQHVHQCKFNLTQGLQTTLEIFGCHHLVEQFTWQSFPCFDMG